MGIPVRAEYAATLGQVARGDGAEYGQSVEQEAGEEDGQPSPAGQVFVQHEQAVSEVEVGLPGMPVGKRPSTDVVDDTRGFDADFVAGALEAPAEVDFLHVHIEPLIEQAAAVERVAAEEDGGARGPEYAPVVVVLAGVGFEGEKEPAPREGVPERIQEATRGAGVFEPVALAGLQQLGLDRGARRVSVEGVDQWFQPAGRYLDIVIE